jgi:hypothetical protein
MAGPVKSRPGAARSDASSSPCDRQGCHRPATMPTACLRFRLEKRLRICRTRPGRVRHAAGWQIGQGDTFWHAPAGRGWSITRRGNSSGTWPLGAGVSGRSRRLFLRPRAKNPGPRPESTGNGESSARQNVWRRENGCWGGPCEGTPGGPGHGRRAAEARLSGRPPDFRQGGGATLRRAIPPDVRMLLQDMAAVLGQMGTVSPSERRVSPREALAMLEEGKGPA